MQDESVPFRISELAQPPRVPELLAAELRSRILTQELAVGVALPNERDLAEMSGVSRSSVRDALRLLEAEGLVETRIGRGGGTYVKQPDDGMVARSLEVFVLGRSVRLQALLEVRELLEPACAEQAALRRTDDDLKRLRELGDQLTGALDRPEEFLDLNVEWHVAVATASGNELLAAVMNGISRLVRAGTEADLIASRENFEYALVAHQRVLDAIQRQDPVQALESMRRHVCAYAALLEADDDVAVG